MTTKKFRTNSLYYYANKYKQLMTEEEELEKIDVTDLFLDELETMIKEGDIIIININAMMRKGKSTLAFALAQDHIFKLLKKYKMRDKNDKFGMKNIARDHQEHSKMMRNPETAFTVIVTDESNELEKTGENSSTEQALAQVFSDVQAGRYIHRVCCSPKETIDPNADIMLSVIAMDKETMTTHAKLYYRFYEGGQESIQLLGFIRIYVGNVIKTWINESKDLFYKAEKKMITKKEQEELNKLIKEDWYTYYYIKKHEKMELITKEGILRPRTLDYADMILSTIKRLKVLAPAGNVLNKNITKNYLKAEFDKAKIPYSIVGLELATNEAMGVLDVYKSFHQINRKIYKTEHDLKEGNESEENAKYQLETLTAMRKELVNVAQTQIDELERYSKINKSYNSNQEETP